MALREHYDLYGMPRHLSVWLRSAIAIVVGAIVLRLLWLVMPHTPVGVAVDAVLTLVIVAVVVFWALSGSDTDTSQAGPLDAGGGREGDSERPSRQSHREQHAYPDMTRG